MTAVGAAAATLGAVFALVAAVGLVRMPDVFSRLHAATKASTLGVAGLLVGTAFLAPSLEVVVKVVIAIAFQILTVPVAAHAIGRAAYRSGVPYHAEIDELAGPPVDGHTSR